MSQESSTPVKSLVQHLDSIEASITTNEGRTHLGLRPLRSKVEVLEEEMNDSVTNYKNSKKICERLATDIDICEDNLARSYAAGDLDGIAAMEKERMRLISKQRSAREEASAALHALGQVAKIQQEYRQIVVNLDQAVTAYTQAIDAALRFK